MSGRASSLPPLTAPPVQRSSVVCGTVAASAMWGGARRLEGEAYLMGGYGIRLQIEALPKCERVAALARVWQPGRLKGIVASAANGLPFLSTNQVFDIRPRIRKWLAAGRVPNLEQRYLKPGSVLITCSGNGVANNVGKVFASYAAHEGIVISHDLLRVDPRDARDFGWLYAFLRSRFGRSMLRSNQYGSAIKHLEPEHVNALPVPAVDDATRAMFDTWARRVFALRDEAFGLLVDAEKLFTLTIGVAPGTKMAEWFAVSAKSLFGKARRLDGFHYNQVARAALDALSKSGHQLVPLRTLVERVSMPNRAARAGLYRSSGVPFLDSEDIFKINPDITKFLPVASKQNTEASKVKRGWILMARSGQIYGINGSVSLATEWHEDKLIAEHVIRIVTSTRPDVPRPGYLTMALGHPTYGRPLVLRWAFGSGVPELAPVDIETIPIVRLGDTAEEQIAEFVERAGELRRQADEMEDDMVRRAEGLVEAILRGDPVDEQNDAAVAAARLREIEAHPNRLIRGDALERRLDELSS